MNGVFFSTIKYGCYHEYRCVLRVCAVSFTFRVTKRNPVNVSFPKTSAAD